MAKGAIASTVEWDFVGAKGQRVLLEISTRLIEQTGKVIEVEGTARDITERKRLEREILEISNREQRRIGHDLHDGVCQQLAGIALMMASLADQLEEKSLPESVRTEHIGSLINEAIVQTRGVARGLFPVRLEERGLALSLEELAANSSKLFKTSCRFSCVNPPAETGHEVALHVYYIVLEAVANACKHGNAQNILISLEPKGERCLLSVRDDGLGFSLSDKAQTGMGIRIMQYRARVARGHSEPAKRPRGGRASDLYLFPVAREELASSGNGGSWKNSLV